MGNLFKDLLPQVCSNSVCSNLVRTFHPKKNTSLAFRQSTISKAALSQFATQLQQQQHRKMASVVRQNYHQGCEAGINKQVNMELHAHYVYLSMSLYFDRDDIALPGFSKYFKKASAEEAEHAEKFMKFQNSRGGRVVLKDIPKPENDEWGSPLDAMKAALELEKTVNQSIIDLHGLADIKAVADLVTRITRAGPGLGEIMMDKEVAEL